MVRGCQGGFCGWIPPLPDGWCLLIGSMSVFLFPAHMWARAHVHGEVFALPLFAQRLPCYSVFCVKHPCSISHILFSVSLIIFSFFSFCLHRNNRTNSSHHISAIVHCVYPQPSIESIYYNTLQLPVLLLSSHILSFQIILSSSVNLHDRINCLH